MTMIIVNSYEEFELHLGQELGLSEYTKITQDQVNLFADATLDHQWIHTDPERAEKESPFGGTIAHGYLTLSVAPHLWEQIAEIRNIKMMINYGIENLRFGQPVKVGDEVRLRAKMAEIADLRGITKVKIKVDLEIKDQRKPAYTALLVFLYHFK